MNMSVIIRNGKNLLQKMVAGCEYTFKELKRLCDITESELCMAVLYLIKEGKVRQYRTDSVYYQLQ